ncbi:MAG: hypothetical protein L6Q76_07910, partial [Polyangiaceae bacterium]|nr:hypothetical protein [Polyangiaceae bacterium]
MRRILLQLFAVAVLSLPAAAASAEGAAPPPNSRQAQVQAYVHTEEGLRLYKAQQWQEAFDKLRRAEELRHSPTRVLYMARCQYKLGKLLESRALYERVLREKLPKNAAPNLLDER